MISVQVISLLFFMTKAITTMSLLVFVLTYSNLSFQPHVSREGAASFCLPGQNSLRTRSVLEAAVYIVWNFI